jgi:hypothetical protein
MASTWQSRCLLCGAPLVRLRPGRWVPLADVRHHVEETYGSTFATAWPVDQSYCFDDLLKALDESHP